MTDTLDRFIDTFGYTLNLKQVLLMYLAVMASADGKIDVLERSISEQFALYLSYSQAEFKRVLDMKLNLVLSQTGV